MKKLVRETSTDFQQLVASNDSLKKQVKALQNRLRRMPARKPTKAKLGKRGKAEGEQQPTPSAKVWKDLGMLMRFFPLKRSKCWSLPLSQIWQMLQRNWHSTAGVDADGGDGLCHWC